MLSPSIPYIFLNKITRLPLLLRTGQKISKNKNEEPEACANGIVITLRAETSAMLCLYSTSPLLVPVCRFSTVTHKVL